MFTITTDPEPICRWGSLGKDSPDPRPVQPPAIGPVVAARQVGGLHHRYERRAA